MGSTGPREITLSSIIDSTRLIDCEYLCTVQCLLIYGRCEWTLRNPSRGYGLETESKIHDTTFPPGLRILASAHDKTRMAETLASPSTNGVLYINGIILCPEDATSRINAHYIWKKRNDADAVV